MASVPVHVVTGFLGSGKTTLLNAAMISGFGHGTAVIVNEFGEVGLDQAFIQTASEEVVVLRNGCICCRIREDLGATLMQLAELRDRSLPLDRVVIETSGISDPEPILQTLRADFALRARFHVGSVVCTVDALTPAIGALSSPESMAQISAADALVVTKSDLAPEGAGRVADELAALHPDAAFIAADGVALSRFLRQREASPPARFPADFAIRPIAHARPHGVSSVVIRDAAPQSWSAFVVWLTALLHVHGDRILRTKGILRDAATAGWIGVHGVRRFLHAPVHLSFETPPQCGSCLVFITAGLDPARIERSYRRHAGDSGAAAA